MSFCNNYSDFHWIILNTPPPFFSITSIHKRTYVRNRVWNNKELLNIRFDSYHILRLESIFLFYYLQRIYNPREVTLTSVWTMMKFLLSSSISFESANWGFRAVTSKQITGNYTVHCVVGSKIYIRTCTKLQYGFLT